MTIVEALKISKETGRAFEREGPGGYGGWMRYWEDKDNPYYEYLTAADLMADDWVMLGKDESGLPERLWP